MKIIDDLTNASFHTFIDDLIATVKEEIEREQVRYLVACSKMVPQEHAIEHSIKRNCS